MVGLRGRRSASVGLRRGNRAEGVVTIRASTCMSSGLKHLIFVGSQHNNAMHCNRKPTDARPAIGQAPGHAPGAACIASAEEATPIVSQLGNLRKSLALHIKRSPTRGQARGVISAWGVEAGASGSRQQAL